MEEKDVYMLFDRRAGRQTAAKGEKLSAAVAGFMEEYKGKGTKYGTGYFSA